MRTSNQEAPVQIPLPNGRRSLCTNDDLDRLLTLAEWLDDKCEGYRASYTWLLHYATGLGGAVISAAVLVWVFMDPESPLRSPLAGTIMGSAGAVASVSFAYWLHLRRLRAADRRAREETFELLRGAALDFAARDDVSAEARGTLRIRLARLGIGPGEVPRDEGIFGPLARWWRGRIS